jgi:hypothetical protein
MATNARGVAVAAFGLLLVPACDPEVNRCGAGTLLVAVTLESSIADANQLQVSISLDGGAPRRQTVPHTAGQTSGNLVVEFPNGYPRGSTAGVTVSALRNGALVGGASVSVPLVGDCEATPLSVTPKVVEPDAGASDEGVDLSALPTDDLASVDAEPDLQPDLAQPDLPSAPPDLKPPGPDLACPFVGAESCFNGIDDDCDGLTDCADPDCTPTALCVPSVAQPFGYLTQEPKGGSCPAGTTNPAPLYGDSDPTGGGCTGSCGCNASGCSANLSFISGACPGGSSGSSVGTSSCPPTGTPTPVKPPVLPETLACKVTPVAGGGGCPANQVCAPRGTKQCVSTTGVVACPAGYTVTQPTLYPTFNDPRTCTCTCTNNGCAAAQLLLSSSGNCGGSTQIATGDVCSFSGSSVKLVNTCTSTRVFANPLQFTNATTVCCR